MAKRKTLFDTFSSENLKKEKKPLESKNYKSLGISNDVYTKPVDIETPPLPPPPVSVPSSFSPSANLPASVKTRRLMNKKVTFSVGWLSGAGAVFFALIFLFFFIGKSLGSSSAQVPLEQEGLEDLPLAGKKRNFSPLSLRAFPARPYYYAEFVIPGTGTNRKYHVPFLKRLWDLYQIRALPFLSPDRQYVTFYAYSYRGYFIGGPNELKTVIEKIRNIEDSQGIKPLAKADIKEQFAKEWYKGHPLYLVKDPTSKVRAGK